MDVLVQLVFHTLITGSIYALIASGLVFIYATTRVFHLAHGGVIAFAAYVFWWISDMGLPLVVAGLVAILASIILGVLMNEFVYEPLRARKTKALGYLIATIAMLMMCAAVIILLFGAQGQSLGFSTEIYHVVGATISFLQIVIIASALILFLCLGVFVRFSRFGKAMRATADNEVVAEVLGINTRMVRRWTFILGSALGGIAAILYTLEFNLDPNMGVMIAVKGLTAAIIGGPGSMVGAIAGAFLLSGVEQASVWYLGSTWRNAMAFVLLFVFLLVKPTGLFGRGRDF
ncbi:branched-chain amino acid ABC transporter permease [Candidatus Uhrbacteria bacterium]|nr:branched-chain amino acid ABC transporter permease [Candidatus Uhrbacteria bacterium]